MILVTGGTGMLGSHLVFDLVSKKFNVKVLVRESSDRTKILKTFGLYIDNPDPLFEKLQWVTGDISDRMSLELAFEDIDYVYHTAAVVSFNSKHKNKILEVNVEGTANIVDVCLEKGVKKLCFVSSIASIVSPIDGSQADESLIWKPEKNASFYSISKLKSELEVWRGINEGLNAVIVNPSIILGPVEAAKGSTAFFNKITNGMKFYTSGANGFIDVRDVSEIMITLMESNISGERFILNSENLSYKDLFNKIDIFSGKKSNRKYFPKYLLYFLCILDKIVVTLFSKEQLLNRQFVKLAYSQNSYSNSKVHNYINFNFRSINDAIKNIVKVT